VYESVLRIIQAFSDSDVARILRGTGLPGMVPTETAFWELVVQKGLPRFRFLRRPSTPELLDRRFLGSRLEVEWEKLKTQMQQSDQIWPFEINVRSYLGLRWGYVLLRQGRPVGGIITERS
jgi:hypothetical protein